MTTRIGWECPNCHAFNSPDKLQCSCISAEPYHWWRQLPPQQPFLPQNEFMPKCGCKIGTICMNVACPHRAIITCTTNERPLWTDASF